MSQARVVIGSAPAKTLGEIKPLVELCRAGKLFAVQDWIAAGKPVNLPPLPRRSNHARAPLEIAIELGFHSLVEVLLQAGAAFDLDGWRGTMARALGLRRFDIVKTLVEHGYDPKSVDMEQVFDTWDPALMEYFIEKGADVERGNPLAYAFTNRIRTALRIFKSYRDRFPSFQEQANIALRFHCKEGNLKWASLLLWAGADPYASGSEDFDAEPDPEDKGLSALAFAALYRRFDVFKLKQVKLDLKHSAIQDVVRYAGRGEGIDLVIHLVDKGLKLNDQENGGSSIIQNLLEQREWCFGIHGRERFKIDSEEARGRMKLIHVLAKRGARWVPKDKDDIKRARSALTRLTADYTLEFAWIMSKFGACAKECLKELVGTPNMKAHLLNHQSRLQVILSTWS